MAVVATEPNVEPQLAAEIIKHSLEELSPTSFLLAPLFEPPNGTMKRLKAFKNSVENALGGAKLIITGQLWSIIERLESVDPAHIGVAQDPPLCRNCIVALLKPQDIDEVTEIARSFSRLKASAELGCYLCSILYSGAWTPLDSQNSDLPLTQKLLDIDHPPDLFSCRIDLAEDEDGEESGHFRVEATAAHSDDLRKVWQLKSIILIPEEGEFQCLTFL